MDESANKVIEKLNNKLATIPSGGYYQSSDLNKLSDILKRMEYLKPSSKSGSYKELMELKRETHRKMVYCLIELEDEEPEDYLQDPLHLNLVNCGRTCMYIDEIMEE